MPPENDPIELSFDLGPGSIIVVGPGGWFNIHSHESGRKCYDCGHCDFIDGSDASEMSEAHRAIVDERWDSRSEYGITLPDRILLATDAKPELLKILSAETRDFKPPEPEIPVVDVSAQPHGSQWLDRRERLFWASITCFLTVNWLFALSA